MHRTRLARLLKQREVARAPGIYDGLSALLVEQAGFELCFFSGGSYSFARHGRPDLGLVSLHELAEAVAIVRERVELPMIVDMDTGFGNALNVQRSVQVLERSGASALQLEDQVSPKRCGHMAGKNVIPADEMVGKIKAFVDARQHEQTLLVARTDALAVTGFEDALERAERYLEAGADLLFIEAPQSVDQMQQIGSRFGSRAPLVHNLVEGGHSPVHAAAELQPLGYRVALYPVALLHQFVPGARALLDHLLARGETAGFAGEMIDLGEMNRLLGADELLDSTKKYH